MNIHLLDEVLSPALVLGVHVYLQVVLPARTYEGAERTRPRFLREGIGVLG